jgi:hypothetical protein
MTTYNLQWSETESYTPNLSTFSKAPNFVYEKEFDTIEDAKEAYEKELKGTTMKAFTSLDFSPTDEETRTNGTCLEIIEISEDDINVVETSVYYWVE